VGGEAGVILGRLLGDMRVQRACALGRPGGDGRAGVRVDGADAVDRRADARARPVGQGRDALAPGVGAAVGEALLDRAERLGDPAVQVARVEQGDADARLVGGGDQRPADLVGVGVRLAARAVVQVMELAHRGHAGQRHLAEGRPREPVIALGIEALGECVHLLAPGPEAPPPALRAPAQGAMEGVRVSVGEPGQREPR
jgi:hypothetical protein